MMQHANICKNKFFCSSALPWRRVGNCTNITSTQCYLILNQRIMTEYFFRVMAEWKGERSAWAILPQSFQPYAYSEYGHIYSLII